MEKSILPFPDITQLLEQFKLPGVDFTAVIEARRKDIEALTEANRIAYEGMQALAQKEAEILQKTMEELQSAMRDMAASGSPMTSASKQSELAQQAFQKALSNMRELAEIAAKSQSEAFNVINRRAQQNIAELKKLLQSK